MNIKPRIQNENKGRNFKLVNYLPTEDSTIDGAVKNIEYFEKFNDIITDVEKINVEWDQHTDDYKFYKVQKFNSSLYAEDLENESLEDLENYVEYEYVCISC